MPQVNASNDRLGEVDATDCMVGKLIGNYILEDIIGHGTFSTVWRARDINKNDPKHQQQQQGYAIKIIPKEQAEFCPTYNIKKEVLIHENLAHPNIIKLFEARKDNSNYYLVMELSVGGELFEKIEPDVGFPEDVAHMYFVQLLNLLKYLKEQGVAHRDIKPENMLVDGCGNLKITDFGLATVFQQGDQRRSLQTACGTAMYMAPEILEGRGYQGDQVDLWSAAVVLFVMIAGCHPWEEPTARCGHYDCFVRSRCHSYAPWNRFSPDAKDLLLALLKPNPSERLTLEQALEHRWVRRKNPLLSTGDGSCADPQKLSDLLAESHASVHYNNNNNNNGHYDDDLTPALTQLEISAIFSQATHLASLKGFSQPVTTTTTASTGAAASAPDSHMQRLARFYTRASKEDLVDRLQKQLNSMLVQHKIPPGSNRITFSTVDRRKGPLTGEITIHGLCQDLNLVLFSKAKGDSIEFKRFFKFVMYELKDLTIQI